MWLAFFSFFMSASFVFGGLQNANIAPSIFWIALFVGALVGSSVLSSMAVKRWGNGQEPPEQDRRT